MKKKFAILNVLSLLIIFTGYHMLTADARVITPEQTMADTESGGPAEETDTIYITTPCVETAETTEEALEYMGEFSIAAYCGCEFCCGNEGSLLTYDGTPPESGHTIAADLSIFNPGEILLIDGISYTVEDRSPSKDPSSLLLYFDSHEEALNFGRQTKEVYRIPAKEDSHGGKLLGEFTITGYCGCNECCGNTDTDVLTFTETTPISGHTAAADPSVIPLHSQIYLDGTLYVVEDTGSNIKGQRIDIYFDTHTEAVNFGKKQKKVYLIEEAPQNHTP